MKYRRQDTNGDYTFGHGINDYLSDLDAVAQAIKTRLLFFYGEWWEDLSDGLEFFEKIAGKFGTEENLVQADLLIKDRILGTYGVNEITKFDRTYSNRNYSLSCEVNTKYGTTTISIAF